VRAHIVPHGSFHPSDPVNTFALYVEGDLEVTLQAPQITLTLGQVTGNVTCTLELPKLYLLEIPYPPFLFSLQSSPSLGVELDLNLSGPTLSLSGPVGRFQGHIKAGIAYSKTSGWSQIWEKTWTADLVLPVASSSSASFTADAKVF